MRFVIKLCLVILTFPSSLYPAAAQSSCEVRSPDNAYVFQLDADGPVTYSIWYRENLIIKPSQLGFMVEGGTPGSNYNIITIDKSEVSGTWKPVYGEKRVYPDVYNEALVVLKSSDGEGLNFNIRIRAYNEGVAFRYEFLDNASSITITEELTEFALAAHAEAWVSQRAQSPIVKLPVNQIDGVVERPLLLELPNRYFVALGEAGLVDFARMKFTLKPTEEAVLKSALSSTVTFNGSFRSPWRFIMIADKPGILLENNYLLQNLNEPCQLEDVSWIKPGKVIREVTLTTQGGMACVDFAAKYNLQYIEFDAGWYGPEGDSRSDATTVTLDPKRSKGPLELQKVINYAQSKDVGVLMYVNRRALEKQIDDVLPLLKSWGVAGVKYGFVQVGPQQWTSWLHDAVRKAAKHELMIDIHDEYRPTGYSRTYPNLMTQEGIRGDEESPDNSMVLNTLFTRMIAGAGDHTNCYLAERVDAKMGSHASQLAKAICIYSPWQFLFWYDRPEGSPIKKGGAGATRSVITDMPELEFYSALPTVWDDTKVLDGYPGSFAVITRKSGEIWFLGALNGEGPRNFDLKLDFLDKNKNYIATIFSDDTSLKTRTNVRIDKVRVNSTSQFSKAVKKMNGFAVILAPE